MQTRELPPGRAVTFITSGKGSALLKGGKETYEYKFKESQDKRLVFVITGQVYLGYLNVVNNGGFLTLHNGKRGNKDHPAFSAFAWYLQKAIKNPEIAKQAKFFEVTDEDE